MGLLYMHKTSLIAPAVCASDGAATSAVVDLGGLPEGDLVLQMHAAKAVAESGDSMTALWMEGDAVGGPFTDSGLVIPAVGETEDVLHLVLLDRSERKQFGYFAGNVAGDTPAIGLSVALIVYRPQTS